MISCDLWAAIFGVYIGYISSVDLFQVHILMVPRRNVYVVDKFRIENHVHTYYSIWIAK